MLRRNIVGLLVCIAALGVATLGFAGVPDVNNSSATTAAAVQVAIFNVPDGSGAALTDARDNSGATVDATITVTLLDAGGNPVYLFPYEDMWLEATLGGLTACDGGTVADASTDINGQTTFTGPFYASGFSDVANGEMLQVVINGTPLVGSDLDILFNSPDYPINDLGQIDHDNGVCNGSVDLSDLSVFSGRYTSGTYYFDTDFYYDGVLDLSDLVLFSAAMNTGCP